MFVTIVICVYVRPDNDEQGWNSSQEVTHTVTYRTESPWYVQH